MKSIAQQIDETLASLRRAKPRSILRLKLELRLKDLMTRQLKKENKLAA